MDTAREIKNKKNIGRFENKIVVVTGAGSGIGRELALAFAKEGATTVLVGRTRKKIKEVQSQITREGGNCEIKSCDVSKKHQVVETVKDVIENFNRVDILVNAAGILSSLSSAVELTEEDWRKVMSTNLDGTLFFSQAVARYMIKQKEGKIVNMSSIHAFATYPLRVDYATSKIGVMGLTRSLALEWGRYGINVNCIAPGQVRTKAVQAIIDAGKLDIKKIEKKTPLGKIAEVEDIIGPVFFLASEESKHITGQTIIIDGGYLINASP